MTDLAKMIFWSNVVSQAMRESLRFTLHRPPKDASSIAAIEHFWQFAETMPFPLAR
jgi:hypothetical protein